MTAKPTYDSIDSYIAAKPEGVRGRLGAIRQLIHEVAPDATEAISYQMPTFKLGGNLVHFAAWKHHLSLYPSSSTIEEALPEIARRSNGRGTVQFVNSEPLPLDIVRQFLELRLSEYLANIKD